MDNDAFNMSLRKFLKKVGVTSQREIEQAVQASGRNSGSLAAKVTLEVDGIDLVHEITGTIELD